MGAPKSINSGYGRYPRISAGTSHFSPTTANRQYRFVNAAALTAIRSAMRIAIGSEQFLLLNGSNRSIREPLGLEPGQGFRYCVIALLYGLATCAKVLPYRALEHAKCEIAVSGFPRHDAAVAQHDS